ncbi:DNA-binding response regulator KdpE [Blastochloris viridis]|uniref:DNA-binding response regulator KdpE n=1 Tax=Blastochloris viridis TaxID=1079 RepID=A0A182CZL4_BLAVI|nr:DNA-binding response regulator KdpE [Blastochloris viridis]
MLVEDAPFVREILERILTAAGHCCAAVENGALALTAAANTRFDLIITDYDMPDLDGCELIVRLRGRPGPNWTTPIVLLSGYAGDNDLAERALTAGADAVLAKPIVISEVLATLARLMHPRSAR